MGLLDRFGRGYPVGARAMASREDARYLAEWVRTHAGVEAFVEPRTTVTDVTVVLVAFDGEWTRRVVGEHGAHRLNGELGIPVYDVRKIGYPQRMRDHNERARIRRKRAAPDQLRGGAMS
jgi:hypothetical protein